MADLPKEIQESDFVFYHQGKPLSLNQTLGENGIAGDDLIYITPLPSSSSSQPTDEEKIERVRQTILNDSATRAKLAQTQPDLVEAATQDPVRFAILLRGLKDHRRAINRNQPPTFTTASSSTILQNPLSEASRRRIQELLQEQRINENLAHAMEFHPEAFGSVTMLYIPCRVNDTSLKAFVDCGAQATISTLIIVGQLLTSLVMSECAERCGLTSLIDRRFGGIARGVGTGKIVGRVHLVQLSLGGLFLPCSVSIIEGRGPPDMLLGLDMLKRHQCCINLRNGVLEVDGRQISFLPESEIPKDDTDGGNIGGGNSDGKNSDGKPV